MAAQLALGAGDMDVDAPAGAAHSEGLQHQALSSLCSAIDTNNDGYSKAPPPPQ